VGPANEGLHARKNSGGQRGRRPRTPLRGESALRRAQKTSMAHRGRALLGRMALQNLDAGSQKGFIFRGRKGGKKCEP